MQSTSPRWYRASAGSRSALTARLEPTTRPALRRRPASPITSGRQISCTSATANDFMMISGPTPAASPMVIPTIGRAMAFS